MPLYSYKAVSRDGACQSGYRFALAMDTIYKILQAEGLYLTYCRECKEDSFFPLLRNKKIPRSLLITFCHHIAQLDAAGIPIDSAIYDLAQSISHKRFRTVLYAIHGDLTKGISLSQALGKHPKVFDAIFQKLISVAEQTGKYAPQFRHLEKNFRWQDSMDHSLRKSIRTPLILLGLMSLLVVVMFNLVIPNMVELFQSIGLKDLPLSTHLLIHTTKILAYAFPTLLILWGLSAIASLFPPIRYYLARLTSTLPQYVSLAMIQFWHVFSVMMSAGADLTPSLTQAIQVIQNPYLQNQLKAILVRIGEGCSLSKAFQETGLASPIMIRTPT